jgi:hypothetical protein
LRPKVGRSSWTNAKFDSACFARAERQGHRVGIDARAISSTSHDASRGHKGVGQAKSNGQLLVGHAKGDPLYLRVNQERLAPDRGKGARQGTVPGPAQEPEDKKHDHGQPK